MKVRRGTLCKFIHLIKYSERTNFGKSLKGNVYNVIGLRNNGL